MKSGWKCFKSETLRLVLSGHKHEYILIQIFHLPGKGKMGLKNTIVKCDKV